jgi:hypothetical protein
METYLDDDGVDCGGSVHEEQSREGHGQYWCHDDGSMASDNGKRRLRTALLANEDMDLKSDGNLLKAE